MTMVHAKCTRQSHTNTFPPPPPTRVSLTQTILNVMSLSDTSCDPTSCTLSRSLPAYGRSCLLDDSSGQGLYSTRKQPIESVRMHSNKPHVIHQQNHGKLTFSTGTNTQIYASLLTTIHNLPACLSFSPCLHVCRCILIILPNCQRDLHKTFRD